MSVIGYVIVCDLCNAKMLVTADFKHGKFCPDCLDDYISEAIEDAIRDEETSDDNYDETIENGDNNA